MTSNYRDQGFGQRLTTMGDISEGIFESISPMGKWERYGWNRPAITMHNMTAEVRHMPDYYTANGYFVEVGGLGRDGVYKLKLDKYEALRFWNKLQPLKLFVWNSAMSEWALIDWSQLKRLVAKARRRGVEAFDNDKNEYYPIWWSEVEGIVQYG